MTDIANNIKIIKEKIALAAQKAGKNIDDITLVAVSKNVEIEKIQEAYEAGIKNFGENRAQELRDKFSETSLPLEWHFIGSLQTNKVKYVLDKAVLIHSLDRMSLAKEIDRRAKKLSKKVDVLVQVNVSEEDTKSGLEVEETENFISEVAEKYSNICVKGLMTIAPYVDDPEKVRPVFAKLKELQEKIKEKNIPGVEMKYLSMGMTNDYPVAIEEGANIVRIGTAIFGKRN